MSWILHRVDDRLIHGQVVLAWGQRLRPARIFIVDDATAASAWERELLESAAPGIEVRVWNLADAVTGYAGEAAAPGDAFLLVRDLGTAAALAEAGVPIPAFNLGGIHYAPGRTKINEYLYFGDADRAAARRLLARGIGLEAQDVPASRPQPIAELDPQLAAS